MGLLELIGMYGQYLQQKNRATADAFLRQNNVNPEVAKAISNSFNDSGKLINGQGGKVGTSDLFKFRSLV